MTSVNAYRSFPYSSTLTGQAVVQSASATQAQTDLADGNTNKSITDPTDSQSGSSTTTNTNTNTDTQRVQKSSATHSMIQPAEPHAAYPTANTHKLQNNELALQQQLTNYKAVSFSNHGYQGNYIDTTA